MNAEGIDANELSRRYGMDAKSIRRRIDRAQPPDTEGAEDAGHAQER